ncbi:hypothetical protein M1146_04460, partial [Patescibacteria group bacterium]|nr:hypothetical protein [Patescibacteria group bacterium]
VTSRNRLVSFGPFRKGVALDQSPVVSKSFDEKRETCCSQHIPSSTFQVQKEFPKGQYVRE